VVVLDNASGDDLASLISERLPSSNVRVIEQTFRAGFGANHNTVIRATESRYVLVLNPDTRVPPAAIGSLVDYLDRHPEAALAGPLIRGVDGVAQGSAWRPFGVGVHLVWALTLGQRGLVVRANTARAAHAVSACSMIVRREAFAGIDLFDESYFMFSEEWELAERMRARDLERHYVPEIEVLHHGQSSTKHVPERQVNEIWRSLDLYLSRYHSRFKAVALRCVLGLGYVLVLAAAELLRALPPRVRPARASSLTPAVYKQHIRNAFRGKRGPGLRELAEDWNREHVVSRLAERSESDDGQAAWESLPRQPAA
jgi:GT2 family glycosyltransferase